MAKWSAKDPTDVADYWFDWASFLPQPATISSASVTVPTGITKVTSDYTGNKVRVRLSGGTAGVGYDITCVINTDTGETFEITKTLQVKERKVL